MSRNFTYKKIHLDEVATLKLMNKFEAELLRICKETIEATDLEGYIPKNFIEMIRNMGGFQTACELALRKKSPPGFTKLLKYNRPDLTLEYVIVDEEFKNLFEFNPEIIEKCEDRLKKFKST